MYVCACVCMCVYRELPLIRPPLGPVKVSWIQISGILIRGSSLYMCVYICVYMYMCVCMYMCMYMCVIPSEDIHILRRNAELGTWREEQRQWCRRAFGVLPVAGGIRGRLLTPQQEVYVMPKLTSSSSSVWNVFLKRLIWKWEQRKWREHVYDHTHTHTLTCLKWSAFERVFLRFSMNWERENEIYNIRVYNMRGRVPYSLY